MTVKVVSGSMITGWSQNVGPVLVAMAPTSIVNTEKRLSNSFGASSFVDCWGEEDGHKDFRCCPELWLHCIHLTAVPLVRSPRP
jgi:hypothetical protein